MKKLIAALALSALGACSSNPPPQPPTPPPPTPQCSESQACGCWHHPPEALGWLYACCQPGVPGGVVNVQDPAQCIAAPPVEPPVPPVEPPVPPTPGVGCVLAGEEVTPSTQTNTTGPDVNAAMHRLVPRCDIGSDCIINEYTQQSWFAAVGAELRKAGLCAGAGGDEMQVALLRSNPWQNFHIFAGDDSSTLPAPPGARRTVNWSPNSWRGSWVSPGGTTPPVIPPVIPPVTPPTAESCPFLPCPQRLWTAATLPPGWGPDKLGQPAYTINSHPHTMGNIDSTAVTERQEPFCASIGMSPMADGTLRAACPARPDEHPERVPVENWLMFGGPTRDGRMGQNCTPNNTDNAWAFLGGTGNCRMCNVPKTACTPWY